MRSTAMPRCLPSFQRLLDPAVQEYPGVDVWAHVGDQLGDAWP